MGLLDPNGQHAHPLRPSLWIAPPNGEQNNSIWMESALIRSKPAGAIMSYLIYAAAALAEIAGCFAVWNWWKLGRSALWLIPGTASLLLFAWILTLIDTEAAGRAYAAYGGIYIVASLAWLWAVEGVRPDRWDMAGAAICLAGASIILLAPRGA